MNCYRNQSIDSITCVALASTLAEYGLTANGREARDEEREKKYRSCVCVCVHGQTMIRPS